VIVRVILRSVVFFVPTNLDGDLPLEICNGSWRRPDGCCPRVSLPATEALDLVFRLGFRDGLPLHVARCVWATAGEWPDGSTT